MALSPSQLVAIDQLHQSEAFPTWVWWAIPIALVVYAGEVFFRWRSR